MGNGKREIRARGGSPGTPAVGKLEIEYRTLEGERERGREEEREREGEITCTHTCIIRRVKLARAVMIKRKKKIST